MTKTQQDYDKAHRKYVIAQQAREIARQAFVDELNQQEHYQLYTQYLKERAVFNTLTNAI